MPINNRTEMSSFNDPLHEVRAKYTEKKEQLRLKHLGDEDLNLPLAFEKARIEKDESTDSYAICRSRGQDYNSHTKRCENRFYIDSYFAKTHKTSHKGPSITAVNRGNESHLANIRQEARNTYLSNVKSGMPPREANKIFMTTVRNAKQQQR